MASGAKRNGGRKLSTEGYKETEKKTIFKHCTSVVKLLTASLLLVQKLFRCGPLKRKSFGTKRFGSEAELNGASRID